MHTPTVKKSPAAKCRSRSRRPHPIDATLSEAYAAFQAGNLELAAKLYNSARVIDPARRDTLLGLGAVALKRGDLPRAYEFYAEVLKRNPDDPVASAAIFNMTEAEGEGGAARLRLLLDGHADAAYLHAALGNWYARRQRWPDAQQAYFDAARLDGANPDYVFNLAVSLTTWARAVRRPLTMKRVWPCAPSAARASTHKPHRRASARCPRRRRPRHGSPKRSLRIGELLVQKGVVSSDQIRIALTEQRKNRDHLGRILVRLGFATEAIILDVLGGALGQQKAQLSQVVVDWQPSASFPRTWRGAFISCR